MIYDDDAVQAIEVDVWGAFGGAETWVPWSFGVTISRHINLFVNVFCLLINVWTYTVSLWSHGTCMTQSDKNHKKHLSKFVSQWRMRCMTTHSPTCWGRLSKVVRCHVFWHFKPRISFHMMLTLAYSDFHVSSTRLTKSIFRCSGCYPMHFSSHSGRWAPHCAGVGGQCRTLEAA